MRQRYFITSTDTNIGKTFITAALARQAKALGKSVAAYKPVMTGAPTTPEEECDAAVLLRALGRPVSGFSMESIAPWAFRAPLAPSMAARLEKQEINFKGLVEFCRKKMNGPEDLVLIEGVGGVMVPLDDKHLIVDWIEALAIEAILVAGSYLGTLSHTLTALDVLQRRKIPIFAIIVNESEENPVPVADTVDELARFTRLPIVTVKRNSKGDELCALLT